VKVLVGLLQSGEQNAVSIGEIGGQLLEKARTILRKLMATLHERESMILQEKVYAE
jgi:hypothetical protein